LQYARLIEVVRRPDNATNTNANSILVTWVISFIH